MEYRHKCLFCDSPCELTLAFTSEGCSNINCRAHAVPAPNIELAGGFPAGRVTSLRHGPGWLSALSNGMVVVGRGRGHSGSASNTQDVPRAVPFVEMMDEMMAPVVKEFFENTRTGRFDSSKPNISNTPRADTSKAEAEAEKDPNYNAFKGDYLSWPRVLRVIERTPDNFGVKVQKADLPLIGVATLTDIRNRALTALYTYVAIARPAMSESCKFEVRQDPRRDVLRHVTASMLPHPQQMNLGNIHLPAFVREMNSMFISNARPRLLSVAERDYLHTRAMQWRT